MMLDRQTGPWSTKTSCRIPVSLRGLILCAPGQSPSSCTFPQAGPPPRRWAGTQGGAEGEYIISESVISQPRKKGLGVFQMFHRTIRIVIIPWTLFSQLLVLPFLGKGRLNNSNEKKALKSGTKESQFCHVGMLGRAD